MSGPWAPAKRPRFSVAWTRRLWMRLGVVNILASVVAGLMAFGLGDSAAAALVRLGSGFQFMHGMATFACATFMNIGARQARQAPALFLTGSAMFSGSLYARAAGAWDGGDIALGLGAALVAGGWGVLFMAAGEIDRDV